jgi:hypothetical protein
MRRSGFSVFIKYRQRRLGLKRFLPSFEDAAAFAEEMRKTRFHSSEDIYIVDEATGEVAPAPPSPIARSDGGGEPDHVLEGIERELEKTATALESLLRTRRELQEKLSALRAARMGSERTIAETFDEPSALEELPGNVSDAPVDPAAPELAKCPVDNGARAASGGGD